MVTFETVMEIKILHKQGMSSRAIARELGDPFHKTLLPLDSWVTEGIDWVVTHFRPVFQGVRKMRQ